MAIQGPTNFRADKTTAGLGEKIAFTWTAATGDFDGYIFEYHGMNGASVGGITAFDNDVTSYSIDFHLGAYYGPGSYVRYIITAFRGYSSNPAEKGSEVYVDVYYEDSGEGPSPTPTVSGKLEQFQNSLAEQIFPRTIIEGIFRQSDGKSLAELLDLYAPGASPVFTGSISLGRKAGTATGELSFAVGSDVEASGYGSHAEGVYCRASEGYAHAEGYDTVASDYASHAEGAFTTASRQASHAGGAHTVAAALGQTVIGGANVVSTDNLDMFIIGNGVYNGGTVVSRSNCFRVTQANGVYAAGSYNASGADYAEMFEWADGNPCNEDRAGRFVTLDGAKIRIAGPEDDYILGIVSGNPSVVGDVHDDQWRGMYLYDIFGRPLLENAEGSTHTERRQKLNPDYDRTQEYTPRSQRPEWDAVGMLGKLVAVDDGTCQVNGWCTVGAGGIATASESRTKYRVMERLDENHVRVMIL